MPLDRRSLLASLCWMAASPALAADAPPELESYERESGGRIGVYAENLATGAKLAWRADERFVMCAPSRLRWRPACWRGSIAARSSLRP